MKVITVCALALLTLSLQARADFSYTTTSKNTGGAMGGGAGNQTAKYYFKGQKMKLENGDTSTIMDFDAETITTVNNRQKTVTVRKFTDLGAGQSPSGPQVEIDAKETGEKKVVNGYNARELVMTMDMQMPQGRAGGMKMQMEMDMWLSPDVPGVRELRDFYRRNANRFPWAAMANGANPQMQAAMANVQRKIASMDGVTVLQVAKVKSAGGAGMPQMTAAQNDQMQVARARLQALAQQGGPAAAAAQQALGRMGGAGGGGSGSLMEITTESSDFSTARIPDSTFAIPSGYQQGTGN